MNLKQNVDVSLALSARTESTTINSGIVDMAGFEGCMFIVNASTLFGAAALTVRGQMSTANSTAALSNIQGTYTSTAFVASINGRNLVVDFYKPTERYLRLQLNGSSSGTVDSITAIKYGAHRPGSSALNNSTTLNGSTQITTMTTS